MSFATGLKCINCGATYPVAKIYDGCPRCKTEKMVAALTVTYDYGKVSSAVTARDLEKVGPGISKFRSLLPVDGRFVGLGEGNTPLLRCDRLAERIGLHNLTVKDESRNPTWSHKDRLCCVSVSKALDFGAKTVTVSSSGNHGASTAAYAAKAGLDCVVFTLSNTPATFLTMMRSYGARVVPVSTPRGRWALMERCVKEFDWYPTGNYTWPMVTGNPYGFEGYKTLGYELAVQHDWELPDKVLVPTGAGDAIFGIWKAFHELQTELGFTRKMPQMVSVEAASGAPIAKSLAKGLDYIEPVESRGTVALSIGTSTSGLHALKAVKESKGLAVAVGDREIMDAQRLLASTEGLYSEPSAAASVAGAIKMAAEGQISKDEKVVCIITSTGLKDPDSAASSMAGLPVIEADWSTFVGYMRSHYHDELPVTARIPSG